MDILELLKTIKEDWALLVFVFGLGAAWFQGTLWFKRVNDTLDTVNKQMSCHSDSLNSIHTKVDNVDTRLQQVETNTTALLADVHEQEIKLAVLETVATGKRRAVKG